MQPTGRRGSDEDGAAEEEEEGRWHLDEEEDGRRRPDAVSSRTRLGRGGLWDARGGGKKYRRERGGGEN